MNCDRARDTLNSIFDGDKPALAAEAREHLDQCAECREWHASMSGAGHVEFVRRTADAGHCSYGCRPVAYCSSRCVTPPCPWATFCLLALLAIGSLMGMLAAILAWTLLSHSITGDLLWRAMSMSRVLDSLCAPIVTSGRAVVDVAAHVLAVLARVAVGFGPILLWAVALNLVIVTIALIMWRRRPSTTSVCLI